MTKIKISLLTDKNDFLSRWVDLYAVAENTSFFLSPAWIKAWVECAAPFTKLYIVEAHQDQKLVAMGLFGEPSKTPNIVQMREVRLHETGNADLDNIYIEENDFLLAAGHGEEIRETMIDAVARHFSHHDGFVFRNIRAPRADALEAWAKKSTWRYVEILAQPVFKVELTGVAESKAPPSYSKSLRSDLRRAKRLYEARGPLKIELAETAEQKQHAWDKLLMLHEARWRSVGGEGIFQNELLLKFHAQLENNAPENTHLVQVYCGEALIGVLYNFLHDDQVINYQTGFKLEGDNKLKPGFVSHALACEYYQRRGFKLYDFLAGDAEYKRRFGSETHTIKTVALERRSFRVKARNLLKKFR